MPWVVSSLWRQVLGRSKYLRLGNNFAIGASRGAEVSQAPESDQRVQASSASDPPRTPALDEIIDIAAVQALMEDFNALTGLVVALLDVEGKVWIAAGWQDACTKFHRVHPASQANCRESDTALTRGVPSGEFRAYTCMNGMTDVVTPLFVGGMQVGNIFTGQFFYDDLVPDTAFFEAQAERYGFDHDEYFDALARVPRFSHERVDALMRFYASLTEQIAQVGYARLKMSEAVESRIRAEEEIRDALGLSEAIFDESPVGIIAYDESGRCIMANESAASIVGTTTDVLEQHDYHTLEAWRVSGLRDLADTVLADGREREFDYVGESSYGKEINIHMRLSTFMRGGRRHLLNVFDDVTERKAAEIELEAHRQHLEALVDERTADLGVMNEELASTNAELQEATEAKSAFLASMSHELRTPLNSIIGFSGVLSQGLAGPLSDEQSMQIGMINKSGRHLLRLIEDILDLAKIEAGRTEIANEPTDIAPLVHEVIDAVRPLAQEKGLDLENEIGELDVRVSTDPMKVKQILFNLLGNALKFTAKGSVRVSVRSVLGGGCAIDVSDTGSGIAAQDMRRIFEAYIQVQSPRAEKPKGTGLGLHLSQEYARLLGADITVTSELGVGSTFTLTLPPESPDHAE